jgi:hypothetical protein
MSEVKRNVRTEVLPDGMRRAPLVFITRWVIHKDNHDNGTWRAFSAPQRYRLLSVVRRTSAGRYGTRPFVTQDEPQTP